MAELHRTGLPLEVARALGFSGAIGSAAELPALTAEEMEHILNEAPVRRLLPAKLEINREIIEQWLQRALPLAADEQVPAWGAVAEEQQQSIADDEDPMLAMEDASLSRQSVDDLLNAFRERWRRGEAAVRALLSEASGQPDASAVREALLELQTGIGDLVERLITREPSGFVAIDEEQEESLADEDTKAEQEIQRLEAELKRIELKLNALRVATDSGDEEHSPAAAAEEDESGVETPLRGESSHA